MIENAELKLCRALLNILKPIQEKVVYLGGCACALLATDAAIARVPSNTLDLIVNTENDLELSSFTIELRKAGLMEVVSDNARENARGRWIFGPLELNILNVNKQFDTFESRFTKEAFQNPRRYPLDAEKIRLINPAYFLAIKIEAFQALGLNNYTKNSDLDDLIYIIASRPELAFDLKLATSPVKVFIIRNLAELKAKIEFQAAVKRALVSDASCNTFNQRIADIIKVDRH